MLLGYKGIPKCIKTSEDLCNAVHPRQLQLTSRASNDRTKAKLRERNDSFGAFLSVLHQFGQIRIQNLPTEQ